MPPSPKLRDGGRLVGGVEVGVEADAQQQGDADGHVGVTREVAVDLKRIAVGADEVLEARVKRRGVEDAVDEVDADIVRDDAFLQQAADDEVEPFAERLAGHDGRPEHLGDEVAGPNDRSGHESGEEGDVKQVVDPASERLKLTAVDVDGVAERLEGEERNADGQEDVQRLVNRASDGGHAKPRAHALTYGEEGLEEEVGVFEVGQHAQVDAQAERHPSLSSGRADGGGEGPGDEEIGRGGEDKKQEPDAAALIIEVERKEDDVKDAGGRRVAQGAITDVEGDEKEEKEACAEEHRALRLIREEGAEALEAEVKG